MSVELRPISDPRPRAPAQQSDDEEGNTLVHTMPPTDKGAAAWKFLLSSFVIEALLWGTKSSSQGPSRTSNADFRQVSP